MPLEHREDRRQVEKSGEDIPAGLRVTSQTPISGTSIFLTVPPSASANN
jgi:hypothetical protein